MKKYVLQKVVAGIAICAVSVLSMQAGHAQTPTFGGDAVIGNQVGTGKSFQVITSTGADGPYIHMYANGHGSSVEQGSLNLIAGYNANQLGIAHSFVTRSGSGGWIRSMQMLQNGQVNIGDRLPTAHPDYKLSVQGKLVAQSLYVTNPNSWADFVFEPGYKPMALPALESYLRQNKHLPYIPSAAEVINNGYSTAEMDAKLLQTVEELTLQLIELSKQHQEAMAQIKGLKLQVTTLKSYVKSSKKKTRR